MLYQVHRPTWKKNPSDFWIEVSSFEEAGLIANNLPKNSRIFLTIGKKNLEIFLGCEKWMMIRTIDRYRRFISEGKKYITGRGPFSVSSELLNMKNNNITHLITRNSGSVETYAKIHACRILNIPVIMVSRDYNDILGKKQSLQNIRVELLTHFGLNK